MIFGIVAGVLTLFSVFVVILPILRCGKPYFPSLEYDREIYKARLREMEKERAFNIISEREYDSLLAEEGRRLLALEPVSSDLLKRKMGNLENQPSVLTRSVGGALFSALVIPLVAVTGYYSTGSINMPDQPLQARMKIDPAGQSVDVLLQRAENQLAKNPDDRRGWLVVAPIYMHLGRPKDAVFAYRNVMRLTDRPSARLKISLGEALVMEEEGTVNKEAIELFSQAAIMNTEDPRPGFFMAIALNQAGEYEKAVVAWNALIKKTSGNAPWLIVARQQLQLARDRLDGDGLKNLNRDDIRSAGNLNNEERQKSVNEMVKSLAIRLKENPENRAGWKRIIRSYIVLDRKTEALQSIKDAQRIFRLDKKFVRELEQSRQLLEK